MPHAARERRAGDQGADAGPARAALVVVTLAEDLPARETLELAAQARGPSGCRSAPSSSTRFRPTRCRRPPWTLSWPPPRPARGATPDDKSAGPLRATLAMAVGVRAHREAADRVLAGLKRDLGLPMITLPRIPTAEIGPAIIAELTPHLAEQIR